MKAFLAKTTLVKKSDFQREEKHIWISDVPMGQQKLTQLTMNIQVVVLVTWFYRIVSTIENNIDYCAVNSFCDF